MLTSGFNSAKSVTASKNVPSISSRLKQSFCWKNRAAIRYGISKAEQKAYDELSGAPSYYYYAVKTIEYGQVDEAQIKSAENGMVAACRYLVAINKSDTVNWMKVWQRARYMALEVAPKEAEERKSLYSQHIKELDQDYESFFDAARKQHLTRASAVRAIGE